MRRKLRKVIAVLVISSYFTSIMPYAISINGKIDISNIREVYAADYWTISKVPGMTAGGMSSAYANYIKLDNDILELFDWNDSYLQYVIDDSKPWLKSPYREKIKIVKLRNKDANTNYYNYLPSYFEGLPNLQEVVMDTDDTMFSPGFKTFYNCKNLEIANIRSFSCQSNTDDAYQFNGYYTFGNCEKLNTVNIKASYNIAIPAYAFYNCKALTNMNTLKIEQVNSHAFDGCGLVIKDLSNLKRTLDDAFIGATMNLENDLSSLKIAGDRSFKDCVVNMTVLPDTLAYIGEEAFYNTNTKLSDVHTCNITEMGDNAFSGNDIKSIKIIGNGVFNAKAFDVLEELIISDSVLKFGQDLTHLPLKKLYWLGGVSDDMRVEYLPSNVQIYVEKDSEVDTWLNENNITHNILNDSELSSKRGDFYRVDDVCNISLSEDNDVVINNAHTDNICDIFINNVKVDSEAIQEVNDNVIIRNYYFNTLYGLNKLVICYDNGDTLSFDINVEGESNYQNVWKSGNTMIYHTEDNKVIIKSIANTDGRMSDYDYKNEPPWLSVLSNISELIIQDGVSYISDGAFKGIKGYNRLIIPLSINNVGLNAFDGNNAEYLAILPDNVDMNNTGFRNSTYLKTVVLNENNIGQYAINGCNNLETVYRGRNAKYNINGDLYGITFLSNHILNFYLLKGGTTEQLNSVVSFSKGGTLNKNVIDCPSISCNTIIDVTKHTDLEVNVLYGSNGLGEEVQSVWIDDNKISNYTVNENVINISNELFDNLEFGSHDLSVVFTDGFKDKIGLDVNDGKPVTIYEWECGNTIVKYLSDKTINVYPVEDTDGAMHDYGYNDNPEWKDVGADLEVDSIIVHDGVTHLGNYAFYHFKDVVENVMLPDTLKTMGYSLFWYLLVDNLEIPDSVTNFNYDAFSYYKTAIKRLKLPLYNKYSVRNEIGSQIINELVFPNNVVLKKDNYDCKYVMEVTNLHDLYMGNELDVRDGTNIELLFDHLKYTDDNKHINVYVPEGGTAYEKLKDYSYNGSNVELTVNLIYEYLPKVIDESIQIDGSNNDDIVLNTYMGTGRNESTGISEIRIDNKLITDYTFSDNRLTIPKNNFNFLASGMSTLSVKFNNTLSTEDTVELLIVNNDESPSIIDENILYDALNDDKIDINVSFGKGQYNADGITILKIDEDVITGYVITDNVISINNSVLNNLTDGVHNIEITFNNTDNTKDTLELTISNIGVLPSIITESVSFDYSLQENINIEVSLGSGIKGASDIESVSIDDNIITSFSTNENSIILSKNVLNVLSNGEHIINITFNDSSNTSGTLLLQVSGRVDIENKNPFVLTDKVTFDKNKPEDVVISVDLGSGDEEATGVTEVRVNGNKIDGFSFSDGKIVISKNSLSDLEVGTFNIAVKFDNQSTTVDNSSLSVENSRKEPTFNKQNISFDKNKPEDKEIIINPGDSTIEGVKVGDNDLPDGSWSYDNGKITIDKDFLSGLLEESYDIVIKTDNGDLSNGSSIEIKDTEEYNPPVALDMLEYEYYKDFPSDVIIPVQLNSANDIIELKVGNDIVPNEYWELIDNCLVISQDYCDNLEQSRYWIRIKFDDKKNTIISNIMLKVYDSANDSETPLLIHDRILFVGQDLALRFVEGSGEHKADDVDALVIENKIYLPDGSKYDNTESNINMLKKSVSIINDNNASSSNARMASSSNARRSVNRLSLKQRNMVNALTTDDSVFHVEGNYIIVDGEWLNTFGFKEGKNYIIGAIFANDVHTKDPKKIILSVPGSEDNPINPDDKPDDSGNDDKPDDGNVDKPTKPDDGNVDKPTNPDDGNKPDKPSKPDDDNNKPSQPDDGNKPDDSGSDKPNKPDDKPSKPSNPVDGDNNPVNPDDNPSKPDDSEGDKPNKPDDSGNKPSKPDDSDDNKPDDSVNNKPGKPDDSANGKPSGDNKPNKPDDNNDSPNKPGNGNNDNNPINPVKPDDGDDKPDEGDDKPVKPDDGNNIPDYSNRDKSSGSGYSRRHKSTLTENKQTDTSFDSTYRPDIPNYNGTWEMNDGKWCYILSNGEKAKDTWVADGKDWYHIGEDGYLTYNWYLDKDGNWYMLDRNTGACLYGWYYEEMDEKWYFFNPNTGVMLTGWQFIDNKWYFFTKENKGQTYFGNNRVGWTYRVDIETRPYGSMYCNEMTPDDYVVDTLGCWVK